MSGDFASLQEWDESQKRAIEDMSTRFVGSNCGAFGAAAPIAIAGRQPMKWIGQPCAIAISSC